MNIFTVEKWLNGKRSAFSSSWDDMTITSLYDITDESNKRNIKTTIYINNINKEWNTELFYGNDYKKTSNLEFNNSIKDRLKIIHEKGNEIGNHTRSHISLKNKNFNQNIIEEIDNCNKLIASITNQNAFTFSYPHGHIPNDKNINKYLRSKFIACRGADYGKNPKDELKYINTYENINFELLKTIHIGTYPYTKTSTYLNFILDQSIKQKGWLIEYGHGWENDAWCAVSKKTLLEHYDHISNKDIWCDTILNISKYIKQRLNIKFIINKITEHEYELTFENVVNNSPLTASLNSNKKIKIVQDNKIIELWERNSIIYFNLNSYNRCVIKTLQ